MAKSKVHDRTLRDRIPVAGGALRYEIYGTQEGLTELPVLNLTWPVLGFGGRRKRRPSDWYTRHLERMSKRSHAAIVRHLKEVLRNRVATRHIPHQYLVDWTPFAGYAKFAVARTIELLESKNAQERLRGQRARASIVKIMFSREWLALNRGGRPVQIARPAEQLAAAHRDYNALLPEIARTFALCRLQTHRADRKICTTCIRAIEREHETTLQHLASPRPARVAQYIVCRRHRLPTTVRLTRTTKQLR